ncbi:hypothetical protein RRG08_003232 [Elysia crispata]|uniref:Uncharacterized protein n=1 Tax=Elysia crispata TaxID=231223 RepID=A0AAE1E882_9GAST|nr:hypothetical protein RRG08_003232 [Elysia crispata]
MFCAWIKFKTWKLGTYVDEGSPLWHMLTIANPITSATLTLNSEAVDLSSAEQSLVSPLIPDQRFGNLQQTNVRIGAISTLSSSSSPSRRLDNRNVPSCLQDTV